MPTSETGLQNVTITYAQVPDFTGQSYRVASAWASAKRVGLKVEGDQRTEIIVSQSRVYPKALKAGDFSETLTVTTGGYVEPQNDNTMMWVIGLAIGLYIIKQ